MRELSKEVRDVNGKTMNKACHEKTMNTIKNHEQDEHLRYTSGTAVSP